MKRPFWIFSVSWFLVFASSALAARHATVDVDNADLYRGPREDSGLVRKLKKGERVAASNYPTEGYYKVRTADGALGWVKADTLILGEMPNLSKTPSSHQR